MATAQTRWRLIYHSLVRPSEMARSQAYPCETRANTIVTAASRAATMIEKTTESGEGSVKDA